MLKIGHVVVRPGRRHGDEPVEIPVPEELETVPGIPMNSKDVDFYSREYPLQRQQVEHAADTEWAPTVGTEEMQQYHHEHQAVMEQFYPLMNRSGELPPTGTATGEDVTDLIRTKAREMGYLEVGFTAHDSRFIYQDRKSHVKFGNAICLALEQDFEETQSAPSMAAEHGHYGTYEIQAPMGLEMVDYIRSLGYGAQVHGPSNHSAATIPMFVAAGLGQLGANGQLLTPHAGARCRLQIITTDAPVTFDAPVDYGFHAFCQVCQVCVNRCPGRALMREKIWWARGGKEQADLQALPPGNVAIRGLCHLHEGLPDQQVRRQERHGILRRDRAGARQGALTTSRATPCTRKTPVCTPPAILAPVSYRPSTPDSSRFPVAPAKTRSLKNSSGTSRPAGAMLPLPKTTTSCSTSATG